VIIGLSGYAQTGKDTVAQHLVNEYGFTRIAFADPIREALYALDPILHDYPAIPGIRLSWIVDRSGWESVKKESPEVRRLLQRLGTEVARNQWSPDFWVDLAMKKASKFDKVVITDVRFPNEYEAIRGANGDIWRVVKPGISAVNAHPSEVSLDNYTFDKTIINDGSLDILHESIDSLMQN
jgi:hypothetical protein